MAEQAVWRVCDRISRPRTKRLLDAVQHGLHVHDWLEERKQRELPLGEDQVVEESIAGFDDGELRREEFILSVEQVEDGIDPEHVGGVDELVVAAGRLQPPTVALA